MMSHSLAVTRMNEAFIIYTHHKNSGSPLTPHWRKIFDAYRELVTTSAIATYSEPTDMDKEREAINLMRVVRLHHCEHMNKVLNFRTINNHVQ